MTLFWIICAAILLIAILFVAIPLWRGTSKSNAVVRDAANLEILRDQIAEMDNDLKNGLLTPELHAQGKRELEARLLDEVGDLKSEPTSVAHPYKKAAIAAVVILPLLSVGLYMKVGTLAGLNPVMHGSFAMARNASDLQSLEAQVASNPDNPEAIVILARSYVEMGRYADGTHMYERLVKIVPDEPILWADYADAQAMVNNSLLGAPTQFLNRALELDPNNQKALALSGTAAMERGEYAAAVRHWEKLLKLLPAEDSENTRMITEALHQARQMAGVHGGGGRQLEQINQPMSQAVGSVSGSVTLSPALKADPDATLFILARAVQGPKMPLAIVRKQVKDLPMSFTLDDSTSMSPEMKLSNFKQVVVVARISKSGNAMPQSGDMQGTSQPVDVGTKGIKVVIDQKLP